MCLLYNSYSGHLNAIKLLQKRAVRIIQELISVYTEHSCFYV